MEPICAAPEDARGEAIGGAGVDQRVVDERLGVVACRGAKAFWALGIERDRGEDVDGPGPLGRVVGLDLFQEPEGAAFDAGQGWRACVAHAKDREGVDAAELGLCPPLDAALAQRFEEWALRGEIDIGGGEGGAIVQGPPHGFFGVEACEIGRWGRRQAREVGQEGAVDASAVARGIGEGRDPYGQVLGRGIMGRVRGCGLEKLAWQRGAGDAAEHGDPV